jgi:SpoIID/LytB domain protein
MCQQGAIGMAEAGAGYRDILRHYYAGAEVKQVF